MVNLWLSLSGAYPGSEDAHIRRILQTQEQKAAEYCRQPASMSGYDNISSHFGLCIGLFMMFKSLILLPGLMTSISQVMAVL